MSDRTEYEVHFAESSAVDPAEIEGVIDEVVKKALDFSQANKGERCQRLLFLWDVVYATLTVVYTDDSMLYDARHVTKCYFAELDKAGAMPLSNKAITLSKMVRRMIESSTAQSRRGMMSVTIPIFFSDQDRASEGTAGFKAQKLTHG